MERPSSTLAQPMLQEEVSHSANSKVVTFVAMLFCVQALGTLLYEPSDAPTALWATDAGRLSGSLRVAGHDRKNNFGIAGLGQATGTALRDFSTSFHQAKTASPVQTRGANLRALAKKLSSAEVPPQIPRDDLIDQLSQWAENEAGADGRRKFGLPMKVEKSYKKINNETSMLLGFKVTVLRDDKPLTDIGIRFNDQDSVTKSGILSGSGMGMVPLPDGKKEEVLGKNLEIWKDDDNPLEEEDKVVIRRLLEAVGQKINVYYAFGSVWADDAT